MCLFGQSSGEVAPIDPQELRKFGSLYLTRPTLSHYINPVDQLDKLAEETFGLVDRLTEPDLITEVFAFEEISLAHHMLERRQSRGKFLLHF